MQTYAVVGLLLVALVFGLDMMATGYEVAEGEQPMQVEGVEQGAGEIGVSEEITVSAVVNQSACGTLGTPNTVYVLNSSVVTTGTCFTITAANVTLDGNGYNITYGNSTSSSTFFGVYSNRNDTTIRNVSVSVGTATSTYEWLRMAVYFFNNSNGRIENVDASALVTWKQQSGIHLNLSSNNTLSNIIANSNVYGIQLRNASGNQLSGIVANSSAQSGVYLERNSSNNRLTNITVNSNLDGMFVRTSSDNNIITGIVANSNRRTGVWLSGAYGGTCSNNTLNGVTASSNVNDGVSVGSCVNCTLANITAEANSEGIGLLWDSNCTLSNNNMSNNRVNFGISGLNDAHFANIIDLSNIVDYSYRIYYNYSISDYTFDPASVPDAGMVICAKCDNVTILDMDLSGHNATGIYFFNTTNSRIENVTASNSSGISLRYGSNNVLAGITSSFDSGIGIMYSVNNELSNINASSNQVGISIREASNITLDGINASSNLQHGLTFYNLNNSRLSNITSISNSNQGISLLFSLNNTLSGVVSDYNGNYGIYLGYSNNTRLTDSSVSGNTNTGMQVEYSSNNSIYNNFFNNTNNVNFTGTVYPNYWNTTLIAGTNTIGGSRFGGNFWAAPNGTGFSETCADDGGNGICDGIYVLNSQNTDYYPLTLPKPTFQGNLDLDNDGYVDLLFSNQHNGTSAYVRSVLYYGSASGFDQSNNSTTPILPGPLGSAVADLNNDGYLDLLFTDSSSGVPNSTIFFGSAAGYNWSNNRTLNTSPSVYGVCVADLNADDYLEIIYAINANPLSTYMTNSSIYWGSAGGYTPANRTLLPTTGATSCRAADLNLDGRPDIIFTNIYNGSSYAVNSTVYWNSASGFSATNRTGFNITSGYGSAAEDLNNDGYPDLVLTSSRSDAAGTNSTSFATIFWGSAAGFNASNMTRLPAFGPVGVAAADLNGDGRKDLVIANNYNGTSYQINSTIYWNSASGFNADNKTGLPTSRGMGVAIGDINSDSYPDIVFSNYWFNSSIRKINSTIYWGSPLGYSPSNVTQLPTEGGFGVNIVVGDIAGANTAFGSTVGATMIPDFAVENSTSLADVTDLDVYFWDDQGDANLTLAAYGADIVNITIDPASHRMSITPLGQFAGLDTGIYINATDPDGYSTRSNAFSVRVLANTTPIAYHVSPANASTTDNSETEFGCNVTDAGGLAGIELHVWDSAGINETVIFNQLSGYYNSTTWNVTLPYEDIFYWDCLGSGVSGKSAWSQEGNYTRTFNATVPLIAFVAPTPASGATLTTPSIAVNVTANDTSLTNITVRLYDSSGLVASRNSTASPLFADFTALANGVYYFNATAFDRIGNSNSTETRTVTVAVPTPPGGGGGRHIICNENWTCNEWQSCSPNGTQTRACFEANYCAQRFANHTITYVYSQPMPETTRHCTYRTSCANSYKDVGETDIDCGGRDCEPCDLGKRCIVDSDCKSRFCLNGICTATTCSDGIKNQAEEAVDCGGPCAPCVEAPLPVPPTYDIAFLFILLAVVSWLLLNFLVPRIA